VHPVPDAASGDPLKIYISQPPHLAGCKFRNQEERLSGDIDVAPLTALPERLRIVWQLGRVP
jgi:hypothetical protein